MQNENFQSYLIDTIVILSILEFQIRRRYGTNQYGYYD